MKYSFRAFVLLICLLLPLCAMAQGLDVPIQIDGGVNTETIAEAARAGVSICVAGTGVFKAPDAAEAIRALRESARAALG